MSAKTYKREVAVALLIWLAYIVEVKEPNLIEILVWPIFSFVGAAFGFDAYFKQGPNEGKLTTKVSLDEK